jgi:hypothetical protein
LSLEERDAPGEPLAERKEAAVLEGVEHVEVHVPPHEAAIAAVERRARAVVVDLAERLDPEQRVGGNLLSEPRRRQRHVAVVQGPEHHAGREGPARNVPRRKLRGLVLCRGRRGADSGHEQDGNET